MKRAIPFLVLLALVLVVVVARAAITLTTPIVSTTSYVTPVSFTVLYGPNDTGTTARITYGPSDANGNLIAGPTTAFTTVILTGADVTAFIVCPSCTMRMRAIAALQSNQPSLAGSTN